MLKKFFMLFVLADNFLTNSAGKIFRKNWALGGQCRQCGSCCRRIILTMTPAQMRSRLFTEISVRWISWLFGFRLLEIDRENNSLAFSCDHQTDAGKCGNYFWRANVCRNYPLVDYFKEPKFLPGCGFSAKLR
jgi:hypothetical protein